MNDEQGPGLSRGVILFTSFFLVIPIYLMAGWLLMRFTNDPPLLSAAHRFTGFLISCGVALAAALWSARMRNRVSQRGRLFGMALSETPAFIGLIYLFLSRDGVGFSLLLVITAAAFAWQGMKRTPD